MKEYKVLLEKFLSHLNAHVHSLDGKKPLELYEPETYILNLGGKRLRPLLALIACDLFDKDPDSAFHSALAVELFHNFSLIHDDILDAAPLRRNKPTVHEKWGTNIAILSGDVMLVKAFKALENYPAEEYKVLNSLFTQTAIEVCEGQQLDMNFEKIQKVSVDEYLEMISKKTAVLLGCSLQMGAVNAGASKSDQQHIYEFGKHLGIAFQLLDDLLDAFASSSESFGKQVGGDIIANKKTFLLLKAFELSSPSQKKEIEQLIASTEPKKKVERMLELFQTLGIKELCIKEANKHTDSAINSLSKVSAAEEKKNTLKNFALELLNRQI